MDMVFYTVYRLNLLLTSDIMKINRYGISDEKLCIPSLIFSLAANEDIASPNQHDKELIICKQILRLPTRNSMPTKK